MGLVNAWKVCQVHMCCCASESNQLNGALVCIEGVKVLSKHILNSNQLNVVAQASKKDRFALYLRIRVDLMLEWGL
ncbi:uncharacterized protein G2W53_004315 [Senna tora]|uniref:Uncharacterized protein n=1 Tax=Senna tora TaxID=362788 RepID=A0A834XCV0_9FABA|nr:uncharacterized protein G2W53_004315 [Senna tora]